MSNATDIMSPPNISVNQWTPDINLPKIVTIIIMKDKIFENFDILFLNSFLLTIIELPHIHVAIKVWDEGNEASKKPFIKIGL